MVSAEQLREAMRRFVTGVTVVTTLEDGGGVHGMTANALTSVSLDPPLVLLCVGHQRNTYKCIQSTGRFAINVLEHSQADVAEYFALDDGERVADAPVAYEFTELGSPRVRGAISFMDCEVVASHVHGDHTIFLGAVKDTSTEIGKPLLFYKSRLITMEEFTDVDQR